MSYTYYPKQDWDEDILASPYLNVANGNCHIPAAMMGVSFDDGIIPSNQMDSVLLRLQVAYTPSFIRETVVQGNITFYGTSDEQIEGYRTKLLEIAEYCKKYNLDLFWS